MNNKKKFPQILLLFFLLSAIVTSAQVKFDGFSIQPKASLKYGIRNNPGILLGLKINTMSNDMIYSIAYDRFSEYHIVTGDLFTSYTPEEEFNQVSAFIGKFDYINERQRHILEFQVGLSVLWGITRGDEIDAREYYGMKNFKFLSGGITDDYYYEQDEFTTVGVPVHVGLRYRPGEFVDFGFDLDMNINMKSSYLALGLSMCFGKMPKSKIPTE